MGRDCTEDPRDGDGGADERRWQQEMQTELANACRSNDVVGVRNLLELGVSPMLPETTALHIAASAGALETFICLTAHIPLRTRDRLGRTAAHDAATALPGYSQHPEGGAAILTFIRQHQPAVLQMRDRQQQSPRMVAARWGNHSASEVLGDVAVPEPIIRIRLPAPAAAPRPARPNMDPAA